MSRARFAAMLPLPMFAPNPRLTLALLLALAVVILGGGLQLARHEESVRLDRDRSALQHFAADAQSELQRLEALYENDVANVVPAYLMPESMPPSLLPEAGSDRRRAAARIVGVQQISYLHHASMNDTHLQVYGQRLPVPVLRIPRSGLTTEPVLLSEDRLFDLKGPERGWLDEPGKPLFFWQRQSPREVVAYLIDRDAVSAAISRWLGAKMGQAFEAVRAEGGLDQLRSPDGLSLLTVGNPQTARPDVTLLLRSRFGSWELVSWDRREIHIHYNPVTIAASSALALLVAMLGFFIFAEQCRAAVLAAQRVSFVNRVSHELRTPLTNILLNLDLASESVEDVPRDAIRRLGLVQEEARRLGRLIDNVLTFSRHEQGKLRPEPRACVPASVIAAVVEQFAPSFARRSLEMRTSGDLSSPCLLDADAFAQVLANLLSNVEKYVPGGLVEINGTLRENLLTIQVHDQGPGIPSEAAERIFRPFERLNSRINEGASGTGLGLAIARDLAVSMGGTLRLIPSERGACFELRIPAPAAPPLASISAA